LELCAIEYRRRVPELILHDRPIATVFDLLGHDEKDMTASLGWALAHNSALLGRFVERVAPGVFLTEPPAIDCRSTIGPTAGSLTSSSWRPSCT